MANVFLISSRNRRSMRTATDSSSKPKNHTVKRTNSSSDYVYSCKKHPKHRQSPGICSLCLNESLSKLSSDFHENSSSMSSSSLAKTVSSCSSSSSESESESDYSSTAISSHYSSVSSCLSPLQHRYSEIVVNSKKKKKHVKKQSFLSRLFM
ncbi:hypothetical protein CARUB_v10010560mg [Capsella rubella]|uniref:Uncharacterized protein n=1 Tax=Capsella rubella TaxID=81985 RepID=R0INE9_9BRAS|nr:uncharacterized protein LOC17897523 [Capsella rubella]EOA38648.1 hypothetical protein CARUB_v10010560mg [Capsella rubella]